MLNQVRLTVSPKTQMQYASQKASFLFMSLVLFHYDPIIYKEVEKTHSVFCVLSCSLSINSIFLSSIFMTLTPAADFIPSTKVHHSWFWLHCILIRIPYIRSFPRLPPVFLMIFWEILKLLEIGSLELVHLQKHSGFHVFRFRMRTAISSPSVVRWGRLRSIFMHFLLRWFVVVGW